MGKCQFCYNEDLFNDPNIFHPMVFSYAIYSLKGN